MKKPKKPLVILSRAVISVFTALGILCAFVFGGVAVINYGPSKTFRDLFVMSMLETSAAKFLATWYFSDAELEQIIKSNSVTPDTGVSDPSLIVIKPQTETTTELVFNPDIPSPSETKPGGQSGEPEDTTVYTETTTEADKSDGIEIFDVSGSTYSGKLMVVSDPSRLFVGVSGDLGDEYAGKTVPEIAKLYNATAAINGGRFEDEGGYGDGGTPVGIVISQGQVLWGEEGITYEIIGFNSDNVFIVGNMTVQQALDAGIRDAVSFGPILIMNGVASDVKGSGGGLNPRTAIGQRADGAILLLTVDGRQTSSLGASYSDLIKIMKDFGAVNAANLDGGNSTAMYYKGQIVNNVISWYMMRDMPTCFVVK